MHAAKILLDNERGRRNWELTALKCVPMNSTFLKRDIKSVITKCDHISNPDSAQLN